MEENKKISNILSNPWVSFSIGTAVGVIGVKGAEYAKKKIDEYARNIAEEHLRAQARYLAEELRKDNVSSVSEKIYQEVKALREEVGEVKKKIKELEKYKVEKDE